MNRYADEARERWGDTDAYQESERRAAGAAASDQRELRDGMDAVMEGFAELKKSGISPDDASAHSQVAALKKFVTDRLYTCTDEILSELGQLYVADERFTENIDRHGEGTAAYIAACIKSYCKAIALNDRIGEKL